MTARLVPDLPFRDYLARDEVSHSAAWPALSSPLEAKHRRESGEETRAMLRGRAIHSAALTPDLYPLEYQREPDWRSVGLPGAEVSIVRRIVEAGGFDGFVRAPTQNKRAKADGEAWARVAEERGVSVDDLVRPATWTAAEQMLAAIVPGACTITDADHALAARLAPLIRAELDRIPRRDAFAEPGRAEVSIVEGELYGLPARCRLDWIATDVPHPATGEVADLIVDLKTTGKDITGRRAASIAYRSGYMAQLRSGRELYRQATGREAHTALLWVTTTEPHWTALQWVDVDSRAVEAQVRGAWTRYPASFDSNPAGPTLPLCIGAPSWAEEE